MTKCKQNTQQMTNIKKEKIFLTETSIKRIPGVETLEDLVENYSKQELKEDYNFRNNNSPSTHKNIVDCVKQQGLSFYRRYYDRIKAQGDLPKHSNPRNILLVDCDFSEDLLEKLRFWNNLKTFGDLAKALRENKSPKSRTPALDEFIKERTVVLPRPKVTKDGMKRTLNIGLTLREKRELIRKLAIYRLYPADAILRQHLHGLERA